MNKKILVATDCSEFSEGAEREAISIGKSCRGQIYIMSVIEDKLGHYPEFLSLQPSVEEKEKEVRAHLERIKDRAAKDNVECEIIIRHGAEVFELIVEEADKRQSGLIVMGRRGRRGLMRLLMGSATARVIGHTPRNVLVVPRASSIQWKNIVIATDGSKYSEAAASAAINLIKDCSRACTLNVIAVEQPGGTKERVQISQDSINAIKSNAEIEKIKVDTLVVKDRPDKAVHETIIEYAQDKDADIIVMGSHGRMGIQKLLMGSVAERVIGFAGCAVLVAK